MSSTRLKSATKYVVTRAIARKQTKKKQKDSQSRSDAEKTPGQFFVINKEHQAALIFKHFGIKLSKKERNTMMRLIRVHMEAREARISFADEKLKRQLMAMKSRFKKKPGDMVFMVSNFEGAKAAKYKARVPKWALDTGGNASLVQAKYVNSLKRLGKEITGKQISGMSALGHGDRSASASQFGLDRAIAEASDKYDLSPDEQKQLQTIVNMQRVKHKMKINASHSQIITSKGEFQKSFKWVLSSQSKLQNEEDRKKEVAAFQDSLEEFEILHQETSTSLFKAVEQTVFHNFAEKRIKNKRIKGTHKAKITERSSTSINNQEEEMVPMAMTAIRGLQTKGIKKPKGQNDTKKSAAATPLHLITLINKELPQVVAGNMMLPGLENRSGRFAGSVRVTDVIKTPKGYPSIGYTYQQDPYQVFETGSGKPPWSSRDRDPRRVIDKSIREIAAQYALGRFFTRRV